jgi:hypothetical protein
MSIPEKPTEAVGNSAVNNVAGRTAEVQNLEGVIFLMDRVNMIGW